MVSETRVQKQKIQLLRKQRGRTKFLTRLSLFVYRCRSIRGFDSSVLDRGIRRRAQPLSIPLVKLFDVLRVFTGRDTRYRLGNLVVLGKTKASRCAESIRSEWRVIFISITNSTSRTIRRESIVDSQTVRFSIEIQRESFRKRFTVISAEWCHLFWRPHYRLSAFFAISIIFTIVKELKEARVLGVHLSRAPGIHLLK